MVRVIRNKYEDKRYLAVLLFVPDSAHTRRLAMCLMKRFLPSLLIEGGRSGWPEEVPVNSAIA